MDILAQIVARKRRENDRRRRRCGRQLARIDGAPMARPSGQAAVASLRRPAGSPLRVITEIKLRSPSAGEIRPRRPQIVQTIARAYASAGATAISVLCDGPGFGGTPLDLRRAARAVDTPLLFKEFVLEEMQLQLAHRMGASLVLLLVRVLPQRDLERLVEATLALGMAPVVEAADAPELERALATRAEIVGINARDLRTFTVDPAAAESLVARIPASRVAVHMSGVKTAQDMARVASGRADAVLVGEALMRAHDPGAQLRHLCDR